MSRRADPHLKSMGSYERHAWSDACSIAFLLNDLLGAKRAELVYGRINKQSVSKFEDEWSDEIATFIGMTEGRREAFVRKRFQAEASKVCFLVLAIQGCLQAKAMLELRDRYRELLAPGHGNRETTQAMYEFAQEAQRTADFDWPSEPFEAIGVDTYLDEEDKRDMLRSSPLPDEITLNARQTAPVQAKKATTTEICVVIDTPEMVKASSGGSAPAWRLQWIMERGQLAMSWLSPEAWSTDYLVTETLRLAEVWDEASPAFLFSSKQKQLIERINAAAQRELAGMMPPGASRRRAMSWGDELLANLKRELELVREAMPSAQELMDVALEGRYYLSTHAPDPINGWKCQRGEVVRMVRRILAARGRWVGVLPTAGRPLQDLGTRPRDLARVRRDVAKMSSQNLTAFGRALLSVTEPLLSWHDGHSSIGETVTEVGAAFLRHDDGPLERAHFSELASHVAGYFGADSQEHNLLDFAVCNALNGPFCIGERSPTFHLVGRVEHLPRATAWAGAWWCPIEVASKDAERSDWLPTAKQMTDAVQHAVQCDRSTLLRVDGGLQPLQLFHPKSPVDTEFAGSSSWAVWQAERLVRVLQTGSDIAPLCTGTETCSRWGVLITALGPSAQAILDARAAWERHGASALQSLILEPPRPRKTPAPRGLTVESRALNVMEPYVAISEGLALMSGMAWDAERGVACVGRKLPSED